MKYLEFGLLVENLWQVLWQVSKTPVHDKFAKVALECPELGEGWEEQIVVVIRYKTVTLGREGEPASWIVSVRYPSDRRVPDKVCNMLIASLFPYCEPCETTPAPKKNAKRQQTRTWKVPFLH